MKNTEYRKGNLVEVSNYYDTEEAKKDLGDHYSEEKEWVVAKIASIENDFSAWEFTLETGIYNSVYNDAYNRVRDIPIKREWLQKFELLETFFNDACIVYSIGPLQFCLYPRQNYKCIVKINSTTLRTIKYVHELQNVFFAIVGEELNLKKS